MWDDGNADAIRQLMSDQEHSTSGSVSHSLAKWKMPLSKALDKLKRKNSMIMKAKTCVYENRMVSHQDVFTNREIR